MLYVYVFSESPDINPIEMVWAHLKREVAEKEPKTKEELVQVISSFWDETLTTRLCNRYIDHTFKVAPVCVLLGGKATGDIPRKVLKESSKGKSFAYFANLLESEEKKEEVELLKQ